MEAGWRVVGELYHAYVTGLIHDRRARLRVEQRPPVDGMGIVWRITR